MNRSGRVAARLPESDRRDLAVPASASSESITDLAAERGVSRNFVDEQKGKASAALEEAFATGASDEQVQFELKVTRRGLRQLILELTLICRGSYRGVIEFLRDRVGAGVGTHVSAGTVHNVHAAAAELAGVINGVVDLSPIEVGLHDENSSRAASRYSPVSMRPQRTAIFLKRSSIVTPTLGACICWRPARKGSIPSAP